MTALAAPGLVICIGPNGHAALEASDALGTCSDCTFSRNSRHEGAEGASLGCPGSSCVDVPVIRNASLAPKLLKADSATSPALVPIPLIAWGDSDPSARSHLASDWIPPPSPKTTHPFLLRSVVLVV